MYFFANNNQNYKKQNMNKLNRFYWHVQCRNKAGINKEWQLLIVSWILHTYNTYMYNYLDFSYTSTEVCGSPIVNSRSVRASCAWTVLRTIFLLFLQLLKRKFTHEIIPMDYRSSLRLDFVELFFERIIDLEFSKFQRFYSFPRSFLAIPETIKLNVDS